MLLEKFVPRVVKDDKLFKAFVNVKDRLAKRECNTYPFSNLGASFLMHGFNLGSAEMFRSTGLFVYFSR